MRKYRPEYKLHEQHPHMMTRNHHIRPCNERDLAAIAQIYRTEVLEHVATFEIEPPDETEMFQRWETLQNRGYPWLVYEADSAIAGYAYAGPFRERPAFRYTVENSVYVAHNQIGRGIGRNLLAKLIDECEQRNFRQMIAVISDETNVASIRLHESAGFAHAGVWKSVGWKFDRWLDCVIMQRALGNSEDT